MQSQNIEESPKGLPNTIKEREREIFKMKMFLLGMLVMWVLMSVGFVILDYFFLEKDFERDYVKLLFPLVIIVAIICDNWYGFIRAIKALDLCVKYKINPFHTSITEISKKLSKEDKEIFIKRVSGKDERLANKWRKALDI